MPLGNHVIRLSKSCLGAAETNAVSAVLSNEFLGMGSKVNEFESLLENFFGRTALCVSNGTAALQLALQACNVGPGDEVLVQSLTYVASFQAISATGAKPVSCDIEGEDGTISISDCQRRLTKRTKAIMPVHYGGGVGKLDLIHQFAKSNGLRIIEDAAHAFGSSYKGRRIGSFGDVACFSFDGIKNITSGEGGCIVTSDEQVLEKISDSRLLGVKKDSRSRYEGERSWLFQVEEQGWRYHMSDIMAAIGIVQLGRFEELASDALSHYGGSPTRTDANRLRDKKCTEMLGKFIDILKRTKEADGSSLFDHTLLSWGTNLRHGHMIKDVPAIVAGGGGRLKMGHSIVLPEEDTPLGNLWVTLLRQAGVKVDSLGSSTGILPELLA